ncbi:MAG: Flp pilus assembly complex ATPase component TadA, partial [Gemmatimonadales bacterium]|nr:Flp pilus assembly complex ATPase component TadA [Gemmatimonadales bacterium]
MARLDRLIQVMHEQRADALHLVIGKPASLVTNGSARAITRETLTDSQIQGLVREIASPEAAGQIGDGGGAAFGYRAPSGEVQVELTPGAEGTTVVLRPAARPQGASAASTATTAAAPPAGRSADDLAEARRAIEELFRVLVSSGASDLHLRTGKPPLLRLHGELSRQERPAIPAERLAAMLASIMSPREVEEFRELGDTDWAYEMEGLARFRCNAGRDRHGPMAVFRVIPTTVPNADSMGLSRELQNLSLLTKGLVVVTGPTGSGKSTTLAALVDLVNRTRADHIVTIEDPIEFVHPSKKCLVTQRQVGVHTRGFKQALRAALREDPDVIL